jgi:uncharacterized protein (DUF1501 family)
MKSPNRLSRRHFLGQLAATASMGAGGTLGVFERAMAATGAADDDRILVVFELSGGNDGLNTVVPYTNDHYYRQRPTLAIRPDHVLKLDDAWGLNPGMVGFRRLWDQGQLAIVHGCGYERPSFSHFTSMAYWHTAAPNSGNEHGWVGRLADVLAPKPAPGFIVNVDVVQSLAVKSRLHTPVVFDEPAGFQRKGYFETRELLDVVGADAQGNQTLAFLNAVADGARTSSAQVRAAWAAYKSPVDYGLVPLQLPKIAACIEAGLPTRLYYAAFRNNAFDTHVQQRDLHQRLLTYAADALHGFLRDLERMGAADRVTVLVFSEFGRRVPENANLGSDHGTANVMFVAGPKVRGGHYGEPPALDQLNADDNLQFTTDFRRVYASVIDGWLKPGAAGQVLGGSFPTLPLFA